MKRHDTPSRVCSFHFGLSGLSGNQEMNSYLRREMYILWKMINEQWKLTKSGICFLCPQKQVPHEVLRSLIWEPPPAGWLNVTLIVAIEEVEVLLELAGS